MDTKKGPARADVLDMTIHFLTKRRATLDCSHETQMTIEIAGLSRGVCETCGKVSVSYVGEHFKSEMAQALALSSAVAMPEPSGPDELEG